MNADSRRERLRELDELAELACHLLDAEIARALHEGHADDVVAALGLTVSTAYRRAARWRERVGLDSDGRRARSDW